MARIGLLTIFILQTLFTLAQVRATTESGNKVLLFDDGTWKYEEKTLSNSELPVVALLPALALHIDTTKEIRTEPTALFAEQSPILVKYFGAVKGVIHCKVSCSNTKGAVKVHLDWELPVGDGLRYYGRLVAGRKVTIEFENRDKIELLMGDENDVEFIEKYNFTILHYTSVALSQEHLQALLSHPVRTLSMEWKKDTETYEVGGSDYFMNTLPEVF